MNSATLFCNAQSGRRLLQDSNLVQAGVRLTAAIATTQQQATAVAQAVDSAIANNQIAQVYNQNGGQADYTKVVTASSTGGSSGGGGSSPSGGSSSPTPSDSGSSSGSADSGGGSGGSGSLSRAVRGDDDAASIDSDTSAGAAAELKLRGGAKLKLCGGAESSADAGSAALEQPAEHLSSTADAAEAAAAAGISAAEEAEQAAKAIVADAGELASAAGSGSGTSDQAQRPPKRHASQELDSVHGTASQGDLWANAAEAAAADAPGAGPGAGNVPATERQTSRSGSFLTDSVIAAEVSVVAEAARAHAAQEASGGAAEPKAAPKDEVAAHTPQQPALPAADAGNASQSEPAAAADDGSGGDDDAALGGLFDEDAGGDAAPRAGAGAAAGADNEGRGWDDRTGTLLTLRPCSSRRCCDVLCCSIHSCRSLSRCRPKDVDSVCGACRASPWQKHDIGIHNAERAAKLTHLQSSVACSFLSLCTSTT